MCWRVTNKMTKPLATFCVKNRVHHDDYWWFLINITIIIKTFSQLNTRLPMDRDEPQQPSLGKASISRVAIVTLEIFTTPRLIESRILTIRKCCSSLRKYMQYRQISPCFPSPSEIIATAHLLKLSFKGLRGWYQLYQKRILKTRHSKFV